MMTVPLATGFCPERWKKEIDVMLEKIPGVVRSNKLRIIQLLEADLNQLLRIAFARNIAKLAKNNKGIGRNYTCLCQRANGQSVCVYVKLLGTTEGISQNSAILVLLHEYGKFLGAYIMGI
jgi:hypothetical protein